MILCLYVDDILLIKNCTDIINDVKITLSKELKMKDLGVLKSFLGIDIEMNSDDEIFFLSRNIDEQNVEKF